MYIAVVAVEMRNDPVYLVVPRIWRKIRVRQIGLLYGRQDSRKDDAGPEFSRRYADEIILCVNNLARHAQYVELDLREFDGWLPMELWSGQGFPRIGTLPYLLTLNGRDFMWFKLEPPGGPQRLGAVAQESA